MSIWLCSEHGAYGGDIFCPKCGMRGSYATLAPMTNTPSPTDEDRELIERLRRESNSVFPSRMRDGHAYHATACALDKAADRLESLLSDRAKMEEALRTIGDDNSWPGFSPAPQVERMRELAKDALNRSTDRAT